MVISIIAAVGFYLHSFLDIESALESIATIGVTAVLTILLIYGIGLTVDERAAIKRMLIRK